MSINLQDYYSGGYFITKHMKRPDVFTKALPENILSLSRCICDFLPDSWAIEWARNSVEESEKTFKKFGISNIDTQGLVNYITSLHEDEIGMWNVCNSLDFARKLYNRFLSGADEVSIIGAGLHKSLYDEYIKLTTPPVSPAGFAPNGELGLHKNLKKQITPATGQILGYELLSASDWSDNLPHTWLCCGMVEEIQEKFEILPNKDGFIESFEDALKSAEYMTESNKGEPGPWFPWRVIKYDV